MEDFFCKPIHFSKFQVGNWFEFTCPSIMFSGNSLSDVNNYHAFFIIKKKKLDEWVNNNIDTNRNNQMILKKYFFWCCHNSFYCIELF